MASGPGPCKIKAFLKGTPVCVSIYIVVTMFYIGDILSVVHVSYVIADVVCAIDIYR